MRVGVDVTYMHTNFGERDLSGFGDIATFKNGKFPFLPMDYSPWSSKNLINQNQLKKFMQVGVDVTYMHTNFGKRDLSDFGDIATFKNGKFPFLPMDYSPWSSKNLINRNQLKKFMQVGVDVTYMHTNFGKRDLSDFGDIATFKNGKFPFLPMDYSPWSSKNLINRNQLEKFMQVGVDVTYMHTNFGERDLSSFGDIATFKNGKFPFLPMDYSPWSSKN